MSRRFAKLALEDGTVFTGRAFGADNHVRLSYATSLETIEDGLRRLAELLEG